EATPAGADLLSKSAVFGSFSAAGLLAGGRGSPTAPIVEAIEELDKAQAKRDEKLMRALERGGAYQWVSDSEGNRSSLRPRKSCRRSSITTGRAVKSIRRPSRR